jgi:MYXO-CTERM domain-containing protein
MTESRTTSQIEADIQRQRDHLADTVDLLSHKLEVKAQAKERVARVQDRATTDSGAPRPEVIAGAVALVALVAGVVWWRRR